MPYDAELAQRVRKLLDASQGCNEKKMFGGICYLINGNMACGILKTSLIVRVGPGKYEDSLKLPNTRKFDITGKPMKGWVMVSFEGRGSDEELSLWVKRGVDFALTLPPK